MRYFQQIFSISLSVAACQTTHPTASDVRVVGGFEDYTTHPATVGLKLLDANGTRIIYNNVPATCSGTIVRDDLILTAAHCIRVVSTIVSASPFDKDPEGLLAQRSIKAIGYVYFPSLTFNFQDPTNIANVDIAFFVFPKGSFAGITLAKIATHSAAVGDTVQMTGYGMTDVSGSFTSNPEFKRFSGSNSISQIVPELAQLIIVKTTFVGMTGAILGEGDSGSSLYNGGGEVVGVASFSQNMIPLPGQTNANSLITSNNSAVSGFVNVADPGVHAFISAVMADPHPTAATVQDVTPTVIIGPSSP